MLDSGFFSHPEICSGDQSNISLLATIFCNLTWIASKQRLGRKADSQASEPASLARYSERPPWRATSRLTVDATRSRRLAISRIDEPQASARGASAAGPPEQTHRDATPDNEWTNAPCRRRARSYATNLPPSNGATRPSFALPKAQTVPLGHKHHL